MASASVAASGQQKVYMYGAFAKDKKDEITLFSSLKNDAFNQLSYTLSCVRSISLKAKAKKEFVCIPFFDTASQTKSKVYAKKNLNDFDHSTREISVPKDSPLHTGPQTLSNTIFHTYKKKSLQQLRKKQFLAAQVAKIVSPLVKSLSAYSKVVNQVITHEIELQIGNQTNNYKLLIDPDPNGMGKLLMFDFIDKGSFKQVYRMIDLEKRKIVAVAVSRIDDKKTLECAANEHIGFAIANSHHMRGVAKVYRIAYFGICQVMVMKYYKGGTLLGRITDKFSPLSYPKRVKAIKQISHILIEFSQAHLLHRDIKLENFLVDEHDNVFITDFGFACLQSKIPKHKICGSPVYLSPELIDNCINENSKMGYSHFSDVYAAGICFYGAMTNSFPILNSAMDNAQDPELRLNDPEQEKNRVIKVFSQTLENMRKEKPLPKNTASNEYLLLWTTRFDPKERPTPHELSKYLANWSG